MALSECMEWTWWTMTTWLDIADEHNFDSASRCSTCPTIKSTTTSTACVRHPSSTVNASTTRKKRSSANRSHATPSTCVATKNDAFDLYSDNEMADSDDDYSDDELDELASAESQSEQMPSSEVVRILKGQLKEPRFKTVSVRQLNGELPASCSR
jgi:hypothetical protein